MKTVKIVHRTVLAGLLASAILGNITVLGMDSCTNQDSSDEETHESPELATSTSAIWTLLTSQVAGARSLVGYGRLLLEDLLLTEHSAELSHGTDESNLQNNNELLTLYLRDKDAYNHLTQCLPKDMKLLLARSLLNGLPLVDFIFARLGSHCCLSTLQGHRLQARSAQFNSAGDRIVTVSADETAKIWDSASGECFHTLRHWIFSAVSSAQFNSAGDRIVTASSDGTAKIWDVATGGCLHTLRGHGDRVCSAQFNSAGDRIVTASWDRTAKIWGVASGKCLHTLQGHGDRVCSAQFNSAGDRIVTVSADETAKIWDVASGICLHTLQGHDNTVCSAQFNRAGDRMVTASNDSTAKIWDVATGGCLHTLQGHGDNVNSARFNNAGDRIVTSSMDGTAKIWDVASGKCLHTLQGHGDTLSSARFNSAGDRIVTASNDSTAKIWDVGSLVTSPNWLKRECSLEQALLLHCIYEARIAGHGLQKWFPHLQADSGTLPRPVFDFNAFPHLQEVFDTMPPLVKACLEPFVINKQEN